MPEPLWQPRDPLGSADRATGPPHTDGRRTTDAAVTTVLLVLLLPLGLGAMVLGLLGGLGVSGCGADATCESVLETWVIALVLSPPVLWLVALGVSLALLLRHRPAWWVPCAAALVWVVLAAGYVGAASTLQP